MSLHSISHSLAKIKLELGDTKLIAVSKYHTVDAIEEAYRFGQRDFGESRVQELIEKADYFVSKGIKDIRWHFIGRLQTNKINLLLRIPGLAAIHSIDSVKLLEALIERGSHLSSQVEIFLQFNTSHEQEKGGFRSIEDLQGAVELIVNHQSSFRWAGLMTMGPIRTDHFERDTRQCFSELKQMADQLKKTYPEAPVELSMGMSSDYLWAVEYGSSYVRIGSSIFGE